MTRGVKPFDTVWRNCVWCGGSVLSMMKRCISICSRVVLAFSRGSAVFCHVENVTASRETVMTSACRVTTQ
jgi:hypothetical protein